MHTMNKLVHISVLYFWKLQVSQINNIFEFVITRKVVAPDESSLKLDTVRHSLETN